MKNLLLVEDDKTIALGVKYSLVQEGFQVDVCYDAKSAKKAFRDKEYSLIILDISLPDGNGFELCKLIRQERDTPIIFLTALDEEVNIVMGLDLGADDYITKPFGVRELVSRIKSVLRRTASKFSPSEEITIQDIIINTSTAQVTKAGEPLPLTALEYKLLLTLAHHPGQVLSRQQILASIWDAAGDFVNDNTLTVYIKRLREKIEDNPAAPKIIKTIRGLGYKVG